jgi:hypothetical protein
MTTLSPDTTVTPEPIRSRRRRWAWITIATVGILSASAFLAIPAIAESSGTPGPTPGSGRVVVCETGIETNGDIQMSAATATRVADGDTTPAPEGCREG